MSWKRPFRSLTPARQQLFVLLQGGSGNPCALRVQVRQVTRLLSALGFAFVLFGAGTLLFFRELEINRRLQDRLLDWETRDKIARAGIAPPRAIASPPSSSAPSAAPAAPTTPANPAPAKGKTGARRDDEETDEPVSASVSLASLPPSSSSGPHSVGARIGELTAECSAGECNVHMAMVPTSPGVAQGHLLFVLETEVPRIGSGNPTTQVRKRYFIYPGDDALDELDQETLGTLTAKPFRFSRALQTTASFRIGKLLRPLALNVYLYGTDKTLLHHERRVIEAEE